MLILLYNYIYIALRILRLTVCKGGIILKKFIKDDKLKYTAVLLCTAALLSSCGTNSSETAEVTEGKAETAAVTETPETAAAETASEAKSETAEAVTSGTDKSETTAAVSVSETAASEVSETAAQTKAPEPDSAQNSSSQQQEEKPAENNTPAEQEPDSPAPESGDVTVNLNGSSAECSSSKVSINGSDITITAEGTYRLFGSLNGRITVAAPKDAKVDIELNSVNISNGNGPAIQIDTADKVKIISAAGSDSTLSDGGSSEGCIYSKEDLTIKGDGTIRIHGNVKNAVYSKNTLKITGGTLDIFSQNNGLVGKDRVNIENGNITLNCARDGIKATNEKEAGKGTVSVTGGTINIEAGDDGIQAVSGVTVTGCSVTVKCEGKKVNCDAENSVDEGCITKIKGE